MEGLLKYRFKRKNDDKIKKATVKDNNKGTVTGSSLKTAVLSPIVVPDSPPRSSSNRESSESPIIQVSYPQLVKFELLHVLTILICDLFFSILERGEILLKEQGRHCEI